MEISPKKVEQGAFAYIKDAHKHIWKNLIMYFFVFAFMGAIGFFLSFLEPRISDAFRITFTILFTFFLVELTISSTQEEMNLKKVIICLFIAGASCKRFFMMLKDHTFGMLGFLVYVIPYFWGEPSNAQVNANVVTKMWLYSSFTFSGFILVVSLWKRILIVDEHVVARMMSNFGKGNEDVIEALCSEGARINRDTLVMGLCWGMLFTFLNVFSPFGLFWNIAVVAITLYSMDVYGLDRGRLAKQKQEEKSYVENALPSPT